MNQTKLNAYIIVVFSVIALGVAYILENFGIVPCRLCIYQRVLYYTIIFMSILILFNQRKVFTFLLYSSIVFGIGLSLFQVMIEHRLINYDSPCSANFSFVTSPEDMLSAINSKDLISCDVPQLMVFNISLSGWNFLYMLLMLCISLFIRYNGGLRFK